MGAGRRTGPRPARSRSPRGCSRQRRSYRPASPQSVSSTESSAYPAMFEPVVNAWADGLPFATCMLKIARICLSQIAHEHVGVGDAARARQGGQREHGGAGQQPCRRGAAQAAARPAGSGGERGHDAPRRAAPGLAVGSGFAGGRCAPARRERRERAAGSALRVGRCRGPGARTQSAGRAHVFRLPRSHGARRGVLPAERRPERGGPAAVLCTRLRSTRATNPSRRGRTALPERTQRPAGPGAGCRRSRKPLLLVLFLHGRSRSSCSSPSSRARRLPGRLTRDNYCYRESNSGPCSTDPGRLRCLWRP